MILALRDRSRAPGFDGARLFTAWRGIAFRNGTPTNSPSLGHIPIQLATPEDARRAVQDVAAKKADFIKIWLDDDKSGVQLPRMPEEVYRALLDQAQRHNIRVTSHSTIRLT